MTAELAARRTMAAAVLADFRREAFGRADTDWMAWALRLSEALGALLVGLDAPPGPDEDTGKLREIREVLAAFDWEFHDRQLALEEIERIAGGGA